MDRTRVAAWVAGIGTACLTLLALFLMSESGDAPPAAWLNATTGIAPLAAMTWALAMPERGLARASVPAAYALSTAMGAYNAWVFMTRDFRGDLPWQFWIGTAADLPIIIVATVWAIRPTRVPTLVLLTASAIVLGMSVYNMASTYGRFFGELPAQFVIYPVASLIVRGAFVVGLRPVERPPPPTTL